MPWLILFTVSYILFFVTVDWKKLGKNIWCGILAVFFQTAVDSQAISHGYYKIIDPVISLWGSSIFFVYGPVFVIGILMAQYHPSKRWLIVADVFILAMLFTLQELLLLSVGALKYINWDIFMSIMVNISVITCLSWFSVFFLNKGRFYH